MSDALQQASALVDLLNAWASIDIDLTPAAVAPCTAPSLPHEQDALWVLLPTAHREFFEKITGAGSVERDPTIHANASYDPTERCGYHVHPEDHPETIKARTAAQDFFRDRPVDIIEGQGTYRGPYEFNFDFAIVLDTKEGLIFSFVWNLQD